MSLVGRYHQNEFLGLNGSYAGDDFQLHSVVNFYRFRFGEDLQVERNVTGGRDRDLGLEIRDQQRRCI